MSPKEIKNKLDQLFIWSRDRDNFGRDEDWRTHIEAFRVGAVFRDDCDGYMMTAADALIDAGYAKDNIRYLVCLTELQENHAVCGFEVNNEIYIIDNRQRAIWTARQLVDAGYRFEKSMRLSEPGVWKRLV